MLGQARFKRGVTSLFRHPPYRPGEENKRGYTKETSFDFSVIGVSNAPPDGHVGEFKMPKSGLRVAKHPNQGTEGEIPVARHIRDIKPYVAVSSLEEIQAKPDSASFKIDWNEATVPPTPIT